MPEPLRERLARALYEHAMDEIRLRSDPKATMRRWADRTKSTKDEYRRQADIALTTLTEHGWRIVKPLPVTSDEYRPLSRFITAEWTPEGDDA